jgi:hypothetical protein
MEKNLRKTSADVAARVHELRKDISRNCGSLSTAASTLLAGPMLLWTTRREQKRLDAGITYEPQTFIERRNWVEA